MKRFITATALTLTIAGGAFAATEAEMTEIQTFLPNADVSSWTDTQVATAMNIINSTDSRSNKVGKLQALYDGTDYTVAGANITEAEMAILNEYVTGVDYSTLPQATVDAALNVARSADGGEAQGRIQQLLMDDGVAVYTTNTATAAEEAIIHSYAPDVNVEALSEGQVNSIIAMIHSTSGEDDIEGQIRAMIE